MKNIRSYFYIALLATAGLNAGSFLQGVRLRAQASMQGIRSWYNGKKQSTQSESLRRLSQTKPSTESKTKFFTPKAPLFQQNRPITTESLKTTQFARKNIPFLPKNLVELDEALENALNNATNPIALQALALILSNFILKNHTTGEKYLKLADARIQEIKKREEELQNTQEAIERDYEDLAPEITSALLDHFIAEDISLNSFKEIITLAEKERVESQWEKLNKKRMAQQQLSKENSSKETSFTELD